MIIKRNSFSQWENYDECPQRWRFKSVEKLPTGPAGPAAKRGSDIHETIENYINGALEHTLHPAIKQDYYGVFEKYRLWDLGGDRWTEKKIALSRDFGWVSPEDPNAYVIMVFDVVAFSRKKASDPGIVDIGEWKSGKWKPRHKDQRSLYTLGALTWWQADESAATTHYVEGTAESERLKATSASIPKLIKIWDERFGMMEKDKICAPRPGIYCNWCDFSRQKGGPCKVG